MRQMHLNSTQVEKIAAQVAAGKSLDDVARNYKVSRPTLVNSLKRAGYLDLAKSRSPYRKQLTPELLQQASELIDSGSTPSAAARAIGFTPQALHNKLKAAGRPKKATALKRATSDSSIAGMKEYVALNQRFLSMPMRASV